MIKVLLTIGIISTLLKAGDFFLSAKQKQAVQAFMENLVLWLDYKRPFTLLSNIRFIKGWQIGIIGFFLLGASLFLGDRTEDLFLQKVYMALQLYSMLLIGAAACWKSASQVFDVIDPGKGQLVFILRSIMMILSYLFFAFAAKYIKLMMVIVYILCLPWVSAYNAALSVSIIAVTATIVLLVLESMVRILRFVGWRIIEYTQGAWAGIIILVTTILTIIKMFISH